MMLFMTIEYQHTYKVTSTHLYIQASF